MHILFITPSYFPHIGGVETHIREVSKILSRKGYKVKIISREQMSFPKVKFLGLIFIWLWFLKNLKLVERFDIVHIHDVFIWYLPLRFLFPKKPVFVTFHGYETKFPPTLRARIIRKISEKLAWGNICVGDYIRKWYGTTPDYTTYGGVKSQRSKLLTSSASGGVRGARKILFIGRLDKDTGLPIYLEAIELLKKKDIDFEFELCGDGPLRYKVEGYGKVNGFVKDLTPFLTSSDLVFASSYLSIIEALAYKKPVFAVYNNPLKKDYLRLSPFAKYVQITDNAKDLAKKIVAYLNNRYKIKDMSDKYTWEKVADIYLKLWKI